VSGGQGLGADEALGEGHGDTLRAVETANLPGSGAARVPTCPGATSGGDRPAHGHRVNLRENTIAPLMLDLLGKRQAHDSIPVAINQVLEKGLRARDLAGEADTTAVGCAIAEALA
jgi:hypothetical protein